MSKKPTVDMKAKREYRSILNHYGSQLNLKMNKGKLEEDKFWRLQEKLKEWYDNYKPMKEVEDFTKV